MSIKGESESVLPTGLVLRGAGGCPRLKRNTTLIPDVCIHNADRSKEKAEQWICYIDTARTALCSISLHIYKITRSHAYFASLLYI